MTMRAAEPVFRQIFRSIGGGKRVAVLISAYFDESAEGDSQNGILCVSGYVLDMDGIDGLIPEWKGMLSTYRLPYFHMSECNACCGIYRHLTDDECDKCARQAIQIARRYPLHGQAFVLHQTTYQDILQSEGFDCDPYSFMLWCAFVHVNRWTNDNRPDERISLFFESGYKHQSRANDLLQAVTQDRWGGRNRVASHTFVCKEDSEPTQAADLIAWHIRKGYENISLGKPIRRDTKALFDDRRVLTIEWTKERLELVRNQFRKKSGTLQQAAQTLFSSGEDPLAGSS